MRKVTETCSKCGGSGKEEMKLIPNFDVYTVKCTNCGGSGKTYYYTYA